MQGTRYEIDVYVILLMACSLLELTIVSGLVLSLFRYVIMIWSFTYYFKTLINFQKEPAIIKALTIFYLSLAIYGIVVVVEGKTFQVGIRNVINIVSLNYIYKVTWSLLPIFAFYNFTKKGILTRQYMMKWLYIFAAVVTIYFFLRMRLSMIKTEEDGVTNNAGYVVLSLVPMFIFLKARSWRQYLFMAGAILLVFLSMKRGAILGGLIVAAVYFLYIYRNSKSSTRLGVIIVLIFAAYGAFYVYDRLATTSTYFQERMEDTMEGNTNGRDWIHAFFINYYMNNYTLTEKFIGRGANSTLELFNMFAHNDWIELGINQGLLGMVLYLFFWIAFVRLLLKKVISPEVKTVLLMIFVIYFLKTFFSMSYSEYTLYSSMTFGYSIAMAYEAGKAKKKTQVTLFR